MYKKDELIKNKDNNDNYNIIFKKLYDIIDFYANILYINIVYIIIV